MGKHNAAPAEVLASTQRWVEEFVIGLNLCPFAKAVQTRNQIRYVVSAAEDVISLTAELRGELHHMLSTTPDLLDTTLLIHPGVLDDFLDYNDYLEVVDAVLQEEQCEGILQVASFHPDYQFADSEADDQANFTNRSPWPMLHLLREDSIARAVDAHPDPASIYRRNVQILRDLSPAELARFLCPPADRT